MVLVAAMAVELVLVVALEEVMVQAEDMVAVEKLAVAVEKLAQYLLLKKKVMVEVVAE